MIVQKPYKIPAVRNMEKIYKLYVRRTIPKTIRLISERNMLND